MKAILLSVHVLLAVSLVITVLLQRSEGGALGIGGGGGMSGFMTGRSAANMLTRTTAILAAGFMATSIALAFISGSVRETRSILDEGTLPAPVEQPAAPQLPQVPQVPAVPSPPQSE